MPMGLLGLASVYDGERSLIPLMRCIIIAENDVIRFVHVLKAIFVRDDSIARCGGENRQLKARQVRKRDDTFEVQGVSVWTDLFLNR